MAVEQVTVTSVLQLPVATAAAPHDVLEITQNGVTLQIPLALLVGAAAPLLTNNLADLPDIPAALVNLGVPQMAAAAQASTVAAAQSAAQALTSSTQALASSTQAGASAATATTNAATATAASNTAASTASVVAFNASSAAGAAAAASLAATRAALGQIVSATAASGSLQLTLANGTQLAVPGSLIGPAGATGAAAVAGTPKGVWDASANNPPLTTGGGGGVPGDSYVVGVAGTAAVDGSNAWSVGDVILRGAATWARIPAAGLALAAASLTVPNAALADNGSAGNYSIVDGFGNVVLRIDGTGLTVAGLNAALASVATVSATGQVYGATQAIPNASLADDGTGNAGYSIIDAFGNVVFSVRGTGTQTGALAATSLGIANAAMADDGTGSAIYSVADPFGNIAFSISATGAQAATLGVANAALADDGTGAAIYSIVDPYGYVGFSVSAAGAQAALIGTGNLTLADDTAPHLAGSYSLSLIDQWGFIAGAVGNDGAGYGVLGGASATPGPSTLAWSASDIAQANARNLAASAQVVRNFSSVVARPVWNYSHVITYGQSLSNGFEGWPALSTTQPYDNLMLGQSVRPLGQATPTWTPVADQFLHPLVATNQVNGPNGTIVPPATVATLTPGDGTLGETATEGAVNFFRRQQLQHRGLAADPSRLLIASSCGVGGQTVEQLSKGASPEDFNRLRTCSTAVKAAVAALGSYTYGIAGLIYMQGEYNYYGQGGTTDGPTYQALVAQLYADFCADVVTGISGQSQKPAIFTYQTCASWVRDTGNMGIGMAQLNAALANQSFWYLAAPDYAVTDKNGHLDPNGYRWMGKLIGKVMHKVLTLGQGWLPLYPTALRIRGNTILIDFHVPEPPLAFDVPYVVNTATTYPDQGFTVRNGGGILLISSVTLASDTQVLITLASAPSASDVAAGNIVVSYADQEHNGNGCLRDSDPAVADENYSYTPGIGQYASANIPALVGKPYPLQNWCVGFWLPVTAG